MMYYKYSPQFVGGEQPDAPAIHVTPFSVLAFNAALADAESPFSADFSIDFGPIVGVVSSDAYTVVTGVGVFDTASTSESLTAMLASVATLSDIFSDVAGVVIFDTAETSESLTATFASVATLEDIFVE